MVIRVPLNTRQDSIQRATEEDTHMADVPGSNENTGVGPDPGMTTGIARWQKVVGVIGLVVVLLVVVLMFNGGGPGGNTSGDDQESNTPPIDGAPEVAIIADELAFGPDRIELTAGEPVNVALTPADIPHDLVVDEIDFHLAADRDEMVVGGLTFTEPGTYVGYCSVAGHRESGMELEIVVTPSDGAESSALLDWPRPERSNTVAVERSEI